MRGCCPLLVVHVELVATTNDGVLVPLPTTVKAPHGVDEPIPAFRALVVKIANESAVDVAHFELPPPPPPPPVASSPSQRAALPVIVVQKLAHVVPVTPLKVKPLLIFKLVVVALVVVDCVTARLSIYAGKRTVEDAKNPVWNHSGVVVARVVVPYTVVVVHGHAKEAPVLVIVVTAPVVDIEIPVPAATEDEAVHVGMPESHPKTCPFEPPVTVSAVADEPIIEAGFESVSTPDAVSAEVATLPKVLTPVQ